MKCVGWTKEVKVKWHFNTLFSFDTFISFGLYPAPPPLPASCRHKKNIAKWGLFRIRKATKQQRAHSKTSRHQATSQNFHTNEAEGFGMTFTQKHTDKSNHCENGTLSLIESGESWSGTKWELCFGPCEKPRSIVRAGSAFPLSNKGTAPCHYFTETWER